MLIKRLKRLFIKDMAVVETSLMARVKRAGSDEFVDVWKKPIKNTIVDVGLAILAQLWGDDAAEPFDEGQIGEGTTGPETDDSTLESAVDADASPTFSRITTTVANDTAQLVSEHTAPGGGWSITEYAARNASNVIYNRVTFTAIVLSENDVLEFTYKAQMTRA